MDSKICSKCKICKDLNSYFKIHKNKDRLRSICKDCTLQETKEWRNKNKKSYAHHQSKYRQKHREQLSEYYIKWRDENRLSFLAYQKARKRRVKKATPPWADLNKIEEFYRNCPKGHHVDHIIPLNGKIISGLHVIENLQYLSALENLRKSNKV